MTQEMFKIDELNLFALNVGDRDGIPAVELDITTNEYNILLFTSMEAARRYCLNKKPDQIESIYQLEKRAQGGKMIQSSLIRVTRVCMLRYAQITGIIFDHPGHNKSEVRYATIESIVNASKIRAPKDNKSLMDFLAQAEKDDISNG